MAATFNMPMISHFCSNGATSDKILYRTFARTRPPATIVTKSLASLLLKFNWTRVAIFRPMTSKLNTENIDVQNGPFYQNSNHIFNSHSSEKYRPGDYEDIAISIKKLFKESRIEVR